MVVDGGEQQSCTVSDRSGGRWAGGRSSPPVMDDDRDDVLFAADIREEGGEGGSGVEWRMASLSHPGEKDRDLASEEVAEAEVYGEDVAKAEAEGLGGVDGAAVEGVEPAGASADSGSEGELDVEGTVVGAVGP